MEIHATKLEGELVLLDPLREDLVEPVIVAALSDSSIFRHFPVRMSTRDDLMKVFENALDAQAHLRAVTHVTRVRETGEVVGSTSTRLIDPAVPTVEIGGTWIIPRWQRTRVNTEAKRLQLGHCFETLGCQRVELKTDALNERSRAAMARIGAQYEGIFRSHMRRGDGTLRDSAYFSVIAPDWPAVKAGLDARLARDSACSE